MNMRDRDFLEISCTSHTNTREDLARLLSSRYGAAPNVFSVCYKNKPVAVLGCLETRPNVTSLLFFATDAFSAVKLAFTKFAKVDLRDALFARGVHRIECVSLAGYGEMHGWLKLVGLEQEGEAMKAYGRNREDFVMFALVKEDAGKAGA